MRILYVAPDQSVPGTLGGSVHVQAVSEGLAARGHEMHVAATPGGAWPTGPVTWHALSPPLGMPALRWARAGAVARLARRVGAAVIIERYDNFGGEGVLAARRLRIPSVLEVNAPIVDYPGSAKAALDRALLIQPMRRWRDHVARLVSLFVTPTADILPPWIDRHRVLEVEWGADTTAFRPRAGAVSPFTRDSSRVWCVFAGAFRPWHGAALLAAALGRLHAAGDHRFGAVFIGDGPERAAAERAAANVPAVLFTGALAHTQLPQYLAAADIGVAPFDPVRHPSLQLGFYWSPLKVFEYMACGLPVVAPRVPRLTRLVAHDVEGVLYDLEDARGLDGALIALADRGLRGRLGTAARARAVRDFSWEIHCAALDARLQELVKRA